MEEKQLLQELNSIFFRVFEDDNIIITGNTSPADIDSWDSLNHVLLISAIEKHFDIRFSLDDMLGFQKISDIMEGIRKKLG
jgi:acyl carrier protein